MRRAQAGVATGLCLALAGVAVGSAQTPAPAEENPCLGPDAAGYLCPDLVMKRPAELRIDRGEERGRVLLRSTNSIDNIGRGPAELRGRRDGRKTMDARQAIHRVRGGRRYFPTGGRLYFQPVPGQGRYWKFAHAARFELWKLDAAGRRVRLARVGPKQNYCLRDLRRTRRIRRSPRREVYAACSENRNKRAVTLGTSVGWSDIYPWRYYENWIDITGIRPGRYAYVHIADPRNGIWEMDEENNSSQVIVRIGRGYRIRPGE